MHQRGDQQAIMRRNDARATTSRRWIASLASMLVTAFTVFQSGTLAGCNNRLPPDNTPAAAQQAAEPSWSEQVARVQAGKSHEIMLERTPVNSAQLAELKGLTGLRTLILDAGVVGDQDAPIIATLSGLEHLRLRESPLSDRGLAELARGQLDSLIILNLPQATPTAAGLEELAKLPHVRQLRIGGRQIDDEAIAVLAKWPELTSLHLIGPGITEKSLQTIAGMPELISFYLDDCQLSDAAWEEFFRARPRLHVHIDQAHHDRDPNGDH